MYRFGSFQQRKNSEFQHSPPPLLGYVLDKRSAPSLAGKDIIHVFTEKFGKIACIYQQQRTGSQQPLGESLFALDEIEMILAPKAYHNLTSAHISADDRMHRFGLIAISDYSKLSSPYEALEKSAFDHSHTEKSAFERAHTGKYLALAGKILNTFLQEAEPQPEIWQIIQTLVPFFSEALDIKIAPLLMATLFFAQEAIDTTALAQAIHTFCPKEHQDKVRQDIQLLLHHDSHAIFSHQFDTETVELAIGLLGMQGKKIQRGL